MVSVIQHASAKAFIPGETIGPEFWNKIQRVVNGTGLVWENWNPATFGAFAEFFDSSSILRIYGPTPKGCRTPLQMGLLRYDVSESPFRSEDLTASPLRASPEDILEDSVIAGVPTSTDVRPNVTLSQAQVDAPQQHGEEAGDHISKIGSSGAGTSPWVVIIALVALVGAGVYAFQKCKNQTPPAWFPALPQIQIPFFSQRPPDTPPPPYAAVSTKETYPASAPNATLGLPHVNSSPSSTEK